MSLCLSAFVQVNRIFVCSATESSSVAITTSNAAVWFSGPSPARARVNRIYLFSEASLHHVWYDVPLTMTPTNTQIELLREVSGGRTVFVPKSNSAEDMSAFQVLAEELIELGDTDYLSGCRTHRESHTGKRQIDRVVVAGITAKGRRSAAPIPIPSTTSDEQGVLCPNCNHSLRATAKFCDNCGSSLSSMLDSTLPMSTMPTSTSKDSFVGKSLDGK